MKLGIRLLFAFFVLNGILAFFILRVFTAEIKPSVREVMEDMMVDTANILAELASSDLRDGRLAGGAFAQHVQRYGSRPIDAKIWGLSKQSLDFRVYVTDAQGLVLFDSQNIAQGQDYSRWRDVALTLRGQYGARATREIVGDDKTSVLYVAAPVFDRSSGQDAIIGVLTVVKPIRTVQEFIDRAERKVLVNGLMLLALSAAVGVFVTLWTVWNIRKLRQYAQQVGTPLSAGVVPLSNPPKVPGELGDLARAMQAMRVRLEGREVMEEHIRALTHELKSPVAAITASAELLGTELPSHDRERFSAQVIAQSQRLARLVERMLELSKLEQRAVAGGRLQQLERHSLAALLEQVAAQVQAMFAMKSVALNLDISKGSTAFDSKFEVNIDSELMQLALSNLLDNALDFSVAGSQVRLSLLSEGAHCVIRVQDEGAGVPDYALPRLGERFFTTPRPNGQRSGSGLGLAIVRQIMALHSGQLLLSNTQTGFCAQLLLPR